MTTDNRHKPLDIKARERSAFDILRSGGIVAMPTDTVYGLVAVAVDRAAVERVYEAKVRDPNQPMPVFVASLEQAGLIAELNDVARRLIQRFWPGALTIVLRKKPSFQTRAVAAGHTIGLRAPRDSALRELASQLGPLTGTSANIAGREECHTAAEVRAQLGDAVDLIVDAPMEGAGRPSTIVDCTDPARVRVLREGAVAREALVEALAGTADLVYDHRDGDPRNEGSELMANAPALSPTDARRANDVTSRYRDAIMIALRDALDRSDLDHVELMRRHFGFDDAARAQTVSTGGKMLRPALLLLCCEAVGGDPQEAMPAAAAIELVHNFTLIHDDIEDASDRRHGRETLWRIVGVPLAINAGDGMFVLGQRTLLRLADAGVPAERVLLAAQTLNDACTAVCEGQHRDIGFETRDRVTQAEYEAMIDGKTGALLGASMAIGAIAGGADPATVNALGECGRMLGRAFQIQDDVLGIWGESSVTGKPVADDIRSRKRSFPIAWAFEHLGGNAAGHLARIYSSETIGESDVDAIVSLLNEAGAAGAATTEALRWANAAVDALAHLEIDDGSRRDISALAAFAVHRSA